MIEIFVRNVNIDLHKLSLIDHASPTLHHPADRSMHFIRAFSISLIVVAMAYETYYLNYNEALPSLCNTHVRWWLSTRSPNLFAHDMVGKRSRGRTQPANTRDINRRRFTSFFRSSFVEIARRR